jgi:hypothetical protein
MRSACVIEEIELSRLAAARKRAVDPDKNSQFCYPGCALKKWVKGVRSHEKLVASCVLTYFGIFPSFRSSY